MTNIWYTRDDSSTRHYVVPGRRTHSSETLCGKIAYMPEPLALPVNCDECRTQNAVRDARETDELINDVANGRATVNSWANSITARPSLFVATAKHKAVLSDPNDDFIFEIKDPELAREIGNVLLAWANCNENGS